MNAQPAGTSSGNRIALLALAIGSFGIGTSEFSSMGLMPLFSEGLWIDVAEGSRAITAYAAGVFVGSAEPPHLVDRPCRTVRVWKPDLRVRRKPEHAVNRQVYQWNAAGGLFLCPRSGKRRKGVCPDRFRHDGCDRDRRSGGNLCRTAIRLAGDVYGDHHLCARHSCRLPALAAAERSP